MNKIKRLLNVLWESFRDLLPIILVIGFFQAFVLQQHLPNISEVLTGLFFVVLGLALFVQGLKMGLFPLGESMAHAFARKGSVPWLLFFAFTLGFGTTVAEPALIAVANEAANVAAEGGIIKNDEDSRRNYALGLRLTVALSVGCAILLGVIRIIRGWPLHYLIIGGYIGVVIMTAFAPEWIVGIAYDSGGVTTFTITVPLVTALGVGLASSIKGRNPMLDGFGLIALASLTPMIFVMGFGITQGEATLLATTTTTQVVEKVTEQHSLLVTILYTTRDVLPIIAIIAGFQLLVLRRTIPNLFRVILGFVYVILGLALFLQGLESALFPLGEMMAQQLTDADFIRPGAAELLLPVHWQEFWWIYLFGFAMAFATTLAEPALLAVAIKAKAVSGGTISVNGLRVAVAIGAGVGIALGTFRIVTHIPLYYFIMAGYFVVVIQTWFAPRMIIPLAYDSGGVTTSTITVPLVAALGLGLSRALPHSNPLTDGFGLIALVALFPIITVMGYAQFAEYFEKRKYKQKLEANKNRES